MIFLLFNGSPSLCHCHCQWISTMKGKSGQGLNEEEGEEREEAKPRREIKVKNHEQEIGN